MWTDSWTYYLDRNVIEREIKREKVQMKPPKVMSILEKKTFRRSESVWRGIKKEYNRKYIGHFKNNYFSSKNLSLMLGNLMISKDKIVKVKSIRF